MKKNIGIVLVIILLLAGTVANASPFPAFSENGGMMPPPGGMNGPAPMSRDELKATLDQLVRDKVINQDQEEQVLKHLDKDIPPKPSKGGKPADAPSPNSPLSPLSKLVTDKIITQEQASTIEKTLFKGNMPVPNGDLGKIADTSTAAFSLISQTDEKNNQIFTAFRQDESGIKVSQKASLTLSNVKIATSGNSSSEENSNFYGLNAGLLAESGSSIDIKGSTITTDGTGANAIFATGSGSLVTVSDVKIKTTANSSRGLDATLKGTIKANHVDITTAGMHCAALATDRGNGTIIVNGGTMTTAGQGSPGIYSTGNIQVSNATLTATGSEAAVIEGKNSITLTNTSLTGNKLCGVMLYQSFSGDAEVGISRFTMNGGLLTASTGPAFYVTNTQAAVELSDTTILAPSGILIKASAGRWGTAGANGGSLTFTASHEVLAGSILCDAISSITASLYNSTSFTGAVNPDNTPGLAAIQLDRSSSWNVTSNSYLSALSDADASLSNIRDNGFTIYYDTTKSANQWLKGETYILRDGGKLTPKK